MRIEIERKSVEGRDDFLFLPWLLMRFVTLTVTDFPTQDKRNINKKRGKALMVKMEKRFLPQ